MAISIDPAKAAEWFLSQGFKAFPVWGVTPNGACLCPKGAACDNPGKHPATVRGFKDATDDIERVRTFLSNPGTSNYGLVAPKGVIAVDVDGEAGKAEWDHLQHSFGPLPATLTVVTANGWHFIFRVNPDKVTGKLFGFVTRTEGAGYSIGPGSIHASGVTYGLTNAKVGIQPLPEAWEKGWEKAKPKSDATQFGPPDPTAVIAGQGRHDYLRDRARSLRGQGLTGDALYEAVWALNKQLAEPLTPERVHRAIGRVVENFPEDPPPIVVNFPKAEVLAAQEVQAAQTASLQTLATLPYGTPPSPLVLDTFIAPEGWTVLYANGGTGKGLLALWMMRHVLFEKPESRIAVLDYEGHQWEWGNRARAIGWSQAELERVIYIDPYDPVWKKGHTLSGIAPALRPIGDANDVALYVVDSYTTAAGSDTEMGGVKGAVDFFKAGAALGAPGLVLAHTSAGDERFPAKPFGSSFVHNLARETWAGAQLSSEQGVTVPGLFGVTASSISVELRNKKRSVGGRTSASQVFDIEFRSNGAIRIDYRQNYERPVRDLIADVLATTTGSMTAKQMAAAIKEDTGRDIDETTLRRTIERGVDGLVEDDTRRPKTYSLVQPE